MFEKKEKKVIIYVGFGLMWSPIPAATEGFETFPVDERI